MTRKPGLKRSQIMSLQDFHQHSEIGENQVSSIESTPILDTGLDIQAICTKYNITDLVPESIKWVNLSKKKKRQFKTRSFTSDPITENEESINSPQAEPPLLPDNATVNGTTPTIAQPCPPQSQTTLKTSKCKICDKVFKSRESLKKHGGRCHSQKNNRLRFSCTICGNRFDSREILNCHDRIHQKGRKYGCDICGLRFFLQKEAKAHSKAHTGERPFGCLVCGLAFRLGSSLNLHMKWKHEQTSNEEEFKTEEPEVITLS